VAARRKDADIVVGNVIGSNIFNMLLILALVALIQPVPVPATSHRVDLPVMIGFVAILIPMMLRGMIISRREGVFLLVGYVIFVCWQVTAAVNTAVSSS
jgi:cation:H+ antiporter